MKTRLTLALSLMIWLQFSCDKIDDPYIIPAGQVVIDSNIYWDDSVFSVPNDGKRFVLMEEFTGHTCSNCPEGAEKIQQIHDIYHESFIPMAIHMVDNFSAPKHVAGAPEGSFQSDYRTDEGKAYEAAFKVAGLPGGIVSRLTAPQNKDKWQGVAASVIDKPAIADIDMTSYYDDSTKLYRLVIQINWLEAVGSEYNLQVQMVEDSIKDWQQDNRKDPEFIQDYVHRHMFRGSVNGTWGEPIAAQGIGDKTEFEYANKLDPSNKGFKKEQISFVAFIYRNAEPDKYFVLQVNAVDLIN